MPKRCLLHSACQGMLICPMTSQDVRLLKENNTDGFKCSRGPDFHSVIAQHFLVIIIHSIKLLKLLQKASHFYKTRLLHESLKQTNKQTGTHYLSLNGISLFRRF